MSAAPQHPPTLAGGACDSQLNDPASYASERDMVAAGFTFDFDEEADHGYHAVYVCGAGPIDVALNRQRRLHVHVNVHVLRRPRTCRPRQSDERLEVERSGG